MSTLGRFAKASGLDLADSQPLANADLQIAATAIHHGLELVTGNLRHFRRIPGLVIQPILAKSRHGQT